MIIKVVNRNNPKIHELYANVDEVVDVFDDNGNLCHQIRIANETATFPACEWKFYKQDWVEMF